MGTQIPWTSGELDKQNFETTLCRQIWLHGVMGALNLQMFKYQSKTWDGDASCGDVGIRCTTLYWQDVYNPAVCG